MTQTNFGPGDTAACKHCGGVIKRWEYSAYNGADYDVLDAWWSHVNHPADNHQAEPDDNA